jgi:hypothetical protein
MQDVAEELADHETVLLRDPVQHARVGEVGGGVARRERPLGRGAAGQVELGRLLGEHFKQGLIAGTKTSDREGHLHR